MSCETEWIFGNINRQSDLSFGGGIYQSRGAWTVTRSKVSKGAFPTSELDTSATSLSGYNAGVLETVTPPSQTVLTFGTARTWIRTTDIFVESGYVLNRRPVYVMEYGQSSLYTSAMTIWIMAVEASSGAGSGYWYIAEESPQRVFSQTTYAFSADVPSFQAQAADGFTISTNESLTPNGLIFTPANIWNGLGTSTASVSTSTGKFICSEDSIQYDQPHVEWYTRRQTWVYNAPWNVR